MANPRHGWTIRRFAADTSGAALVEFAITLPFLLLLFAVIIEGSRMMWSYQTAITGVRDATRYVARAAPADICTTGGALYDYVSQAELTEIVSQSTGDGSIFPKLVTVDSVSANSDCIAGSTFTYRNEPAVAVVSAQITIQFPFTGLFALAGATVTSLTTTVTDRSRIFGT